MAVSAGVLSVASNSGLGASSAGTTVASGASLELQNNVTITGEALSLAGPGANGTGALRNLSGSNTYSGAITLTGDTVVQSDAGLLTLNSATPIAGTGFNLTVQGAGNVEIDSAINTGVGGSLTVAGGTVALLGSSNFTGGTLISGGTAQINSPTSLGMSPARSPSPAARSRRRRR